MLTLLSVLMVALFQFYGYLSQQQNMLQDYVRTSTFQRAILDNHGDFVGKVSNCGEGGGWRGEVNCQGDFLGRASCGDRELYRQGVTENKNL